MDLQRQIRMKIYGRCPYNYKFGRTLEKKEKRGAAMGLFRKKTEKRVYDKEHQKPVLRCSICTGEQVAGFQDIQTGNFEEIMLIRNATDLEVFKNRYGIAGEIVKIY